MIKLIPIISYLVGLIILLLLYPSYNSSDKDLFHIIPFLIFWLTTILIIISIFLTIFSFVKKLMLSGVIYILTSISIYAIYKKLLFVDYNTFVHLVFILALFILVIIYRKQKNISVSFSFFLIINLWTILLSNRFMLSYFNSTKIPWTESRMNWEDYKDSFSNHLNENYYDSNGSKTDPKLIHAITTNSIKYKVNTKGSIPSVVVVAFFIPNESFVKEEFKTPKQLNHEHGYVDIFEYHTRLIRKIFKNKTTGMIDYKMLFMKYDIFYVDGIYSNAENAERFIEGIIDRKVEMNERYMLETEFGQNVKEQKKWDMKIRRLLTELEEYK
jgi:hypothetical protein